MTNFHNLYIEYKFKYIKLKNKINQKSGSLNDIPDDGLKLDAFVERIKNAPKNYWKFMADKNKVSDKITYKKLDLYKNMYELEEFKLISKEEIDDLINMVLNIYDTVQPNINNETQIIKKIIPNESNVIFMGDYHSSIHSLLDCIFNLKKNNYFKDNSWELKDNNFIVFTGDLVDRGPYGIECLCLLYFLFIINNKNDYKVIILNGNHEEENIYMVHGLGNELNFQIDNEYIKNRFKFLITRLPVALFLKYSKQNSKWFQFCHGGVDHFTQIDSNLILDFLNSEDTILNLSLIPNGFLWSDFTNNENTITNDNNTRGVISKFDLYNTIQKHNIKMIISGHQDLENLGLILNFDKFSEPINKFYQTSDEGTSFKTLTSIKSSYENNIKNGSDIIETKDVLALIISSATISRGLPYSIYGVLKNENEIYIEWFTSCNTHYIFNKSKMEPEECF